MNLRTTTIQVMAALLLSACVFPMPSPYKEEGDKLPIGDWQVGISLSEDMADRAPPTMIWEDGNTFLYRWSKSNVDMVFFGGSGGGGIPMWNSMIDLATFDDRGVLQSIRTESVPSSMDSLRSMVYGQDFPEPGDREEGAFGCRVIMRVAVTFDGEEAENPLQHFRLKASGFLSVGQFVKPSFVRIDKKHRARGWLVLEAAPGDRVYLEMPSRRRDVAEAPRSNFQTSTPGEKTPAVYRNIPFGKTAWGFDVPDAPCVYAGTFQYERIKPRSTSVACTAVRDEADLAREVLIDSFGTDGEMAVSLAERHHGPLVLRTPLAYKSAGHAVPYEFEGVRP